jgi:threonylcarbamoyladenosine tRNA methylthiotransferase CDKAL1
MKIHVKTFGCSANVAEGEMMEGVLSKKHNLVDDVNDSEVFVVNACTVKGDHTVLREVKKQIGKKKIVIGGCVTPSLRKAVRELDPEANFLTTHNLDKVGELVGLTSGKSEFAASNFEKLELPRHRKNPIVGIVPISDGCLDHCTYCSTKIIKGNLKSYPPSVIIASVRKQLAEGCKELWITSQDTSAYGYDIGTNLPTILSAILDLSGDFVVRVGMGNPTFLPDYLPELVRVLKHPKMFKFLHIPVQSGSDPVLQRMKRRYSVASFRHICEVLRKEIPDLTLSTDIIVGFPKETEEQFIETLKVCKDIGFDVINISRFVARKGTIAAGMDGQIDGGVKKDRSRRLTDQFRTCSTDILKKWIGWKGRVLVDQIRKDGTVVCRNYAYKQVIISGDYPLGTKLDVEITGSTTFYLNGAISSPDSSTGLLSLGS